MKDYGLIHGDALRIPLRDASVDALITSPPYFALRSYQDDGDHYDGQIGSEPTPAEFLAALWAVMDECWRVLKPTGSAFINLGDKYDSGTAAKRVNPGTVKDGQGQGWNQGTPRYSGGNPKSLMGLPWRFALGLTCPDTYRTDGVAGPQWTLRAEIIWCLSGGARVYARTPTGDRPLMIRDLVRGYRPENVKLWNGHHWTQVLGWNRPVDTDGAVELELRSGERIGCTRGHQWPTARGLVRSENIRVGDVIATTRLPEPDPPDRADLIPDDIGWMVGLYLAEGSRSGKTLQFAGHVKEVERHARLARIAERYDGRCAVYRTGENGSTCNMSGAVLLGIIDRYVSTGTAHTKRLTVNAWQRSNNFLAAVVDGYLSGDGHHDMKNDRWRLGFCANDELAADLRTLAARLGTSLTLKRCIHQSNYGDRPGWRGEWRWTTSDHWNTRERSEVVAIRLSRARQFFDIGVADEPHTFALASGVLTHNSKPNGLPESVTDRVRRSHEQWFHFTKGPRYFAAVDEVRERSQIVFTARQDGTDHHGRAMDASEGHHRYDVRTNNPLGKLPGSVWTIPSEPLVVPEHLGVDHYAAFPQEWPRRLILGWTPSGICTACGEGRRPVVEKEHSLTQVTNNPYKWDGKPAAHGEAQQGAGRVIGSQGGRTRIEATITGYACACDVTLAPTTPAVVLDPFVGTGTVPMVARALGRYGVGLDLSHDYLRLARWRIGESKHGAKSINRTNRERQGNFW